MKSSQGYRQPLAGLLTALALMPLPAVAASPHTQVAAFGLIMGVVFCVFGLAKLMSVLVDYVARISDTSATISRARTIPGNSRPAPE